MIRGQWRWRRLRPWQLCQSLLKCTPITVLLILFLFSVLPVGAAALNSEAYWQLVRESKEVVTGLDQLPAAAQRETLENLAARWDGVEEVSFEDGRRAHLDTTLLTRLMRAEPPDLARLQALLEAVEAAGSAWPEEGYGPADLAPLRAILAQPEFQWPEEEPTLWQRLREQLREAFVELLARLLPEGAAVPRMGPTWLLAAIGAIVLFLVLAYAARGLLGNLVTESDAATEDRAGEETVTAEGAAQRARRLSAGGDYRSAVRYLYLSALLLLEEQGILRYDRALTNREYLRRVAGRPAVAAHLADVIYLFDRVWYGFQPIDETRYARYRDQIAALERAARESR
jgi:hypothetical protein